MDELSGKSTIRQIRNALNTFPKGSKAEVYRTVYDSTMKRISDQSKEKETLALRTISWISRAKRDLSPFELQHALAVIPEASDIDEDDVADLDEIIAVCAGLVAFDQETNIIGLVHFTVQEYIENHSESFSNPFDDEIALTCMTYLSFDTFRTWRQFMNDQGILDKTKVLDQYPFYSYAAQSWGFHESKLLGVDIPRFFLDLLLDHDRCTLPGLFVLADGSACAAMTGLHLAAYFGLLELSNLLIDKSHYLDVQDASGQTPLAWASIWGRTEAARLLIDAGCKVDLSDADGRSPLAYASQYGHQSITAALVQSGCDINTKDRWGRTPLIWAAEYAQNDVVGYILKNPTADRNHQCKWGKTALMYASKRGRTDVVESLVGGGAELNSRDMDGQTALMEAVRAGFNKVVRSLINADADPNLKDKNLVPALSTAFEEQKEEIWRTLLTSRHIDVNITWEGRTSLSYAAERGALGFMDDLLRDSRTDVDALDSDFWSPLIYAADEGNEDAVRLLLQTRRVNINAKNYWGQSPLSRAARNGHHRIVETLLECDFCTVLHEPDNTGWTPLIQAAQGGHTKIVELLLNVSSIDPNHKDSDGRSALSWAAARGHIGVTSALLSRDLTKVNIKDSKGMTPLAWAARNGRDAVLLQLLQRDADSNSSNNFGETPLDMALRRGHVLASQYLLTHLSSSNHQERGTFTSSIFWEFELDRDVEQLLSTANLMDLASRSSFNTLFAD
jgi:ankyrin repeat protein